MNTSKSHANLLRRELWNMGVYRRITALCCPLCQKIGNLRWPSPIPDAVVILGIYDTDLTFCRVLGCLKLLEAWNIIDCGNHTPILSRLPSFTSVCKVVKQWPDGGEIGSNYGNTDFDSGPEGDVHSCI